MFRNFQAPIPIFCNQGDFPMNKQELIACVAEDADLSKAKAAKVVDAVFATIVDAVAKGEGFQLIGFGSFKAVKRAARTGRNPANGKTIQIPAATLPKFVAGAKFKAALANKKAKKAKK